MASRTMWRIVAAVAALMVAVGVGITIAIHGAHRMQPVKAPIHHHRRVTKPQPTRRLRKKPHRQPTAQPTAAPLMMPVGGKILANFGWQYSGALNEWYYNPGVTIAAKAGTPVHAAWGGTVTKVMSLPTGWQVTIDNGDQFATNYSHLEQAKVKSGQSVTQGEVVGTVGNANLYSHQAGPHMNFQIYHHQKASNPVGYLHPSS